VPSAFSHRDRMGSHPKILGAFLLRNFYSGRRAEAPAPARGVGG
jgi:hypothetical protein